MSSIFISALLLGFIFNAAPGAVFAETLRRGLQGGYRPALQVQLGSLLGDATWAAIGLSGLALILSSDTLRAPLALVGGLYLAWLGYQSLCDAYQLPSAGAQTQQLSRGALSSGAALSLTNPQNIFYWASIGGAMASLGLDQPSPVHLSVFFAGFMLSSLLWCFICAGLVDWFRRSTSMLWHRMTYALCGITLLALALLSWAELL